MYKLFSNISCQLMTRYVTSMMVFKSCDKILPTAKARDYLRAKFDHVYMITLYYKTYMYFMLFYSTYVIVVI